MRAIAGSGVLASAAKEVRPSSQSEGFEFMGSVIGPDVTITGKIACEGDVGVHGTVEGEIKAKSITVEQGAQVRGSIQADTLKVSGSVDGQIEAASAELTETAKVIGDLVHDTLSARVAPRLYLAALKAARVMSTAGRLSSSMGKIAITASPMNFKTSPP